MDRLLSNVIYLERFMEKISGLDARDSAILSLRLLAEKKTTLDDVGKQLNLTRERVRQIEHKLTKALELDLEGLRAVYRDEVQTKAPRLGVVCMLNHIAPFGLNVAERFGPGQINFSHLGQVFGLYEIVDDICFVPNRESAKHHIVTSALEIHSSALFGIEEFPSGSITSGPVSSENLSRALELLGFTQLAEGRWIHSSNYVDAAAALLNGRGDLHPLESLRDSIDPTISLKSFRQRLMQDSRFSFPESGSVKLVEEGQIAERPMPISALIGEVVPEDGTGVTLDQVTEYVQSIRLAAESSIRAFASRPPFSLEKNFVFRTDEKVKRPRQQPCRTRNLYKLPNGWAIRVKVTGEHIRGSSITMPVSAVTAFNLELRSSLYFEDLQSDEALWLNWDGSQPKARSIRRNLLSIDAHVGDDVMLVFSNGTFKVHKVMASEQGGINSLAAIFPDLYGMSADAFLHQAFMCRELGGVPLIEAMKLRREYDLITRFES